MAWEDLLGCWGGQGRVSWVVGGNRGEMFWNGLMGWRCFIRDFLRVVEARLCGMAFLEIQVRKLERERIFVGRKSERKDWMLLMNGLPWHWVCMDLISTVYLILVYTFTCPTCFDPSTYLLTCYLSLRRELVKIPTSVGSGCVDISAVARFSRI